MWLRNANSLFYEYNWHSLDETLLQGFFVLKILDKAHILPWCSHRVAQKSNFVHDFSNNAGRLSKGYQASRGLSAIA